MTKEQAPQPLVYASLAEADWADALDLVGDEHRYQATVIEGSLYLTPYNEGEFVDPNEVFFAAIDQGEVRNPTGGGGHYLTRQELREIEGHRTYRSVFITESLHASTPQPSMLSGLEEIHAERAIKILEAMDYVDVRDDRPSPPQPPEPPRAAPVRPSLPLPFLTAHRNQDPAAEATTVAPLPAGRANYPGKVATNKAVPLTEQQAHPAQTEQDRTTDAQTNPEPGRTGKHRRASQEWQPCDDCPFTGRVTDISLERTARASDPLASEGDIRVSFRQNEGTDDECESGAVIVSLDSNSYGTGDDYEAAAWVTNAVRSCAERGTGPLTGKKWLGLRTVHGCGALMIQYGDQLFNRRGILKIENAKRR
jgi:hypothetical protein